MNRAALLEHRDAGTVLIVKRSQYETRPLRVVVKAIPSKGAEVNVEAVNGGYYGYGSVKRGQRLDVRNRDIVETAEAFDDRRTRSIEAKRDQDARQEIIGEQRRAVRKAIAEAMGIERARLHDDLPGMSRSDVRNYRVRLTLGDLADALDVETPEPPTDEEVAERRAQHDRERAERGDA